MGNNLVDGVSFFAVSPGTGTFVFGSSRPSFLTPAQAVGYGALIDGWVVSYLAQDSLSSPTQREWGRGIFSQAGNSVARTTVLGGSAGPGVAVNFANPPLVSLTVLAEDISCRLPAATNYYVAASGSDANNGLSPATAFLTLQYAFNYIAAFTDSQDGIAGIQVNVGAGSFAGFGMPVMGTGGIIFLSGAGSALTIITNGPGNNGINFGEAISFYASCDADFFFDGMTLTSTTDCLASYSPNSQIVAGSFNFTPSDISFVNNGGRSVFIASGNYSDVFSGLVTISGNAPAAYQVDNVNAFISIGTPHAISGNPALTTFLQANRGTIEWFAGRNLAPRGYTGTFTGIPAFSNGGIVDLDLTDVDTFSANGSLPSRAESGGTIRWNSSGVAVQLSDQALLATPSILNTTLSNGLNSNIPIPPASFMRITGPTGGFSVGGITLKNLTVGPSSVMDGVVMRLYNTTSQQMTIVNEDASSTAVNRITTLTGGNVVLRTGSSFATLIYDGVGQRWILTSTN